MFSAKHLAVAVSIMFIFVAFDAAAQWSPGGKMVYMGDLNLAASPNSGNGASSFQGVSEAIQPSLNNSSMNTSSIDGSLNNSAMVSASSHTSSSGLKTLDLSNYAHDRSNKNLEGYTNVMYPISGSRGTTATTAGSGGCGCG